MKRHTNQVGHYQPDLFHGAGISRPAPGDDRARELELAREEMMLAGAETLFAYLERKEREA